MEIKKAPKADLENKKTIFMEVGFVIALAVLLFAFEWKTSTKEVNPFIITTEEMMEEEIIPVTQQMKSLPPPPLPAPKLTDLMQIVDNDQSIEDDLEIEDAESEEVNDNTNTDASNFGDYDTEAGDSDEPFIIVETQPSFPGGNPLVWIGKHINYPQIAMENGISGRVSVTFVIERDGRITDVRVLRGVESSIDKEAVRVVSSMPKWNPGKQRGKPVRVRFNLPINFTLKQN